MQDVTLSLQLRILTFKVLHKAFQPSTLSTQILQEPSEERPEASGLARQILAHHTHPRLYPPAIIYLVSKFGKLQHMVQLLRNKETLLI